MINTRPSGGKRAVTFDLGGTLLVMRRDQVFRKVLAELGKPVPLDKVHSAYVTSEARWLSEFGSRALTPEETDEAYRAKDMMAFATLFPGRSESEAGEVARRARELWPRLEKTVPYDLYPETLPVLERLSDDGLLLALVSNAPAGTRDLVDSLGLGKYLKSITISGLVGYSKPHPEIFRLTLRELGVRPDETVHVGDVYESDVVGAANAGIQGILVDRDGYQDALQCPRISSLDGVYGFLK